jgi:hypothetical protein
VTLGRWGPREGHGLAWKRPGAGARVGSVSTASAVRGATRGGFTAEIVRARARVGVDIVFRDEARLQKREEQEPRYCGGSGGPSQCCRLYAARS